MRSKKLICSQCRGEMHKSGGNDFCTACMRVELHCNCEPQQEKKCCCDYEVNGVCRYQGKHVICEHGKQPESEGWKQVKLEDMCDNTSEHYSDTSHRCRPPQPKSESWEERFDKEFSHLYEIYHDREIPGSFSEGENLKIFIAQEIKRAKDDEYEVGYREGIASAQDDVLGYLDSDEEDWMLAISQALANQKNELIQRVEGMKMSNAEQAMEVLKSIGETPLGYDKNIRNETLDLVLQAIKEKE